MNLVEELRKVSNPSNHGCFLCDAAERVGVDDNGGCDTCMNTLFKIADLIEKYYFPKPLFEDGEPVNLGDEFVSNDGKTCPVTSIGVAEDYFVVNPCACNEEDQFGYWEYESVRVKRPEPKVFDADGVLIKVGDMVYSIYNDEKTYKVLNVVDSTEFGNGGCVALDSDDEGWWSAGIVTHKKPLFDAHGIRIRIGDELYDVCDNHCIVVEEVDDKYFYALGWSFSPKDFTHKAPDSQEKLNEDIVKYADTISKLADNDSVDFGEVLFDIERFVRRQRELCEKQNKQ